MTDGITFVKERPMCEKHPTERVRYIQDIERGPNFAYAIERGWCRLCLKELLEGHGLKCQS